MKLQEKKKQLFLLVVVIFCSLRICLGQESPKKEIELDPKYAQIEQIAALADCKGPQGAYTTEVHSTIEGYTYFYQKFSYRTSIFRAILPTSDCGYFINDNQEEEALEKSVQEVLRSHEFHKMTIFPHLFFDKLQFQSFITTDQHTWELFTGTDHLGNEVKITYDRPLQLIRKIEMLNPFNTKESIAIEIKDWRETAYGKMVQNLEIIQAQKDTFSFEFSAVEINEDFERHSSVDCAPLRDKKELLTAIQIFNTAFAEGDLKTIERLLTGNYQHTNGTSKSIGKKAWLNYFKKRKQDIDTGVLVIKQYEMDEEVISI